MNLRAIATKILTAVIRDHQSLTEAFHLIPSAAVSDRDISLIKQYCFGTLRWYFRLQLIGQELIYKPLKAQHQDIEILLLVGLYQLIYLNTPHHAAVSETVAAAQKLKKNWAKGLINQALHQFIRNPSHFLQKADSTLVGEFSHPQWMIDKLQQAWPDHWREILTANNQQAPMFLRVNQQRLSREQYLLQLQQQNIVAEPVADLPHALKLSEPQPVENLPGFRQGHCSVQDLASQHVIKLLDLRPKQRVLDACAAPGGKTCYILETQPALEKLIAIDQDPQRLKLIEENRQRLRLSASSLQLLAVDAGSPQEWWDGQLFDRILLDAPCSGSGVIRRHPDIKILRHSKDIAAYAQKQYQLLTALWPLLAPGGLLLYTTCSIFPDENMQLMQKFCQTVPAAQALPISIHHALFQKIGCQLLPNPQTNDGFFFALLSKKE